jgi:hypothetical protein
MGIDERWKSTDIVSYSLYASSHKLANIITTFDSSGNTINATTSWNKGHDQKTPYHRRVHPQVNINQHS